MPLCAAPCRYLPRRERNFAFLLGVNSFFEPEGRGFESLPARQRFRDVARFLVGTLTHWTNADYKRSSAAIAILRIEFAQEPSGLVMLAPGGARLGLLAHARRRRQQ